MNVEYVNINELSKKSALTGEEMLPVSATKFITPNQIAGLAKSLNDLVYYYTKSDTYSRAEVNALIGSINQFRYEIAASTSAVSSPEGNVLYLIGPTGSGDDRYEEYVYANSTWTKIGDTSIDLSGYATSADLNQLYQIVTDGYYKVILTKTTIPGLRIRANNLTFQTAQTKMEVHYVAVSRGDKIFLTATNSIAADLQYGFSSQVPADGIAVTGGTTTVGPNVSLSQTAPFDGYFAYYCVNTYYLDAVLKKDEYTPYISSIESRLGALAESSDAAGEFLDGSVTNEVSSFESGYYNMTNKAVGDAMQTNKISSTDLETAKVRISRGQIVRCNTMLVTGTAVKHALITDGNVIVALPTTAELNAGYQLTEAQISAGAAVLVVVYRKSNQNVPISLTKVNTYKSIESQISGPLTGKTVILCGDSQLGAATGFEDIIQEKIGGRILNCGFGGCRMSWRSPGGTNNYDAFCMVNIADCLVSGDFTSMTSKTAVIENQPYYADVIARLQSVDMADGRNIVLTIAYGANDFAGGNLIGSLSVEDKTTFLGALAYSVRVLLTAFPRLVILLIGTPYRVYEYETDPETGVITITSDSDDFTRNDGLHRYDFNDAVLEAGRTLKLPAFDMYRRSGRNKYNAFALCPDGTHPTNAAGKQAQAELYVKILQTF